MGADSVLSMSSSESQRKRKHTSYLAENVGRDKRHMEDDTTAAGSWTAHVRRDKRHLEDVALGSLTQLEDDTTAAAGSWTDGAVYVGGTSNLPLEDPDFFADADKPTSTTSEVSETKTYPSMSDVSNTNTYPTTIFGEAQDIGKGNESFESPVRPTGTYVCQDPKCLEKSVHFERELDLKRHIDVHMPVADRNKSGGQNLSRDREGPRSDQKYFVFGSAERGMNHYLSGSRDYAREPTSGDGLKLYHPLTKENVSLIEKVTPPPHTTVVVKDKKLFAQQRTLIYKQFLRAQIPPIIDPIQAYNDLMELVVLPWCGKFAKGIIGPHIITHKLERGSVNQKLIFVTLDSAVTEEKQEELEENVRLLLLKDSPSIGIEFHKGNYGTAARNYQGLGRSIAPDCPGGLLTTLGPSLSLFYPELKSVFLVTRHGMAAERTVDVSTYRDNVGPKTSVMDISSGKKIGITLDLHSTDPYDGGRVSSHPICARLSQWLEKPIKMRSDWAIVTDESDDQKPNEIACNDPESHCNHANQSDRITPEDKFQYVGATSRVVTGSVILGPPTQINQTSLVRAFQLIPDYTLDDIRGDSGAAIIKISQDSLKIIGLVVSWFEDKSEGKIFPMAMDMEDCLEDLAEKASHERISFPKCDCNRRTICNCVGPWVEDPQNEDEISNSVISLVNEIVTSPVQSPSSSFVELGLSSADGIDAESRSNSPLSDIRAGSRATKS